MLKLLRTNSLNKDFKYLVSCLDEELSERYGEIQNVYNQYNIIEDNQNVVAAYYFNRPAGCGCFKLFDPATVEIKRMFVHKDFRGKGISKSILNELEKWAAEENFKKAVLETGTKQLEAIGLYSKHGYKRIDNYGQYAGLEYSVCMMKEF